MKHATLLSVGVALLLGGACTSTVTTDGSGGSGNSAGSGGSGNSAGSGGSGGIDLTSCTRNDQCVVLPASCCGSCGSATRDDSVAVHVDKADDYADMACQGVDGCPACYSPSDPTLIATCELGQCTLVDLHEHASTACVDNSDCRLRSGDCCECGGGADIESLIAINVNSEGAYAALVCDDQGCPECAPAYPPDALAQCNASGYCEVVWLQQ